METVGLETADILKRTFKGKNVLVTGHTGFKGSWLSLWLHLLGANVTGYALEPNTEQDCFGLSGLKDRITDIRGDVRDDEKLKKVFEACKPQVVFHLAAQPLVRLSYERPRETYETNVMGTLNVLECIRHSTSVKAGVLITSDKCYENREQLWGYRENDSLGGYDPYSSSKSCAEILIASYRNSFINPEKYQEHGKIIASARAGNVIGGGDWSADRILPDSIRALKEGRPVEVRNPEAVRPWQHVLEPLRGYMLLACKMYNDGIFYSGAWNFGPDDHSIVPVKEVVEAVVKAWGSGQWAYAPQKNAAHEAGLLSLDCTKAKAYLGWKPVLDFTEAIQYTVDWYKAYTETDVHSLCSKQIEAYSHRVAGI